MEKLKLPEKVTNKEFLELLTEKRILLNNILVENPYGLVIF